MMKGQFENPYRLQKGNSPAKKTTDSPVKSEAELGSDDVENMLTRAMDLTKQRRAAKSISLNKYAKNFDRLQNQSTDDLMNLKTTLDGIISNELDQRKNEDELIDNLNNLKKSKSAKRGATTFKRNCATKESLTKRSQNKKVIGAKKTGLNKSTEQSARKPQYQEAKETIDMIEQMIVNQNNQSQVLQQQQVETRNDDEFPENRHILSKQDEKMLPSLQKSQSAAQDLMNALDLQQQPIQIQKTQNSVNNFDDNAFLDSKNQVNAHENINFYKLKSEEDELPSQTENVVEDEQIDESRNEPHHRLSYPSNATFNQVQPKPAKNENVNTNNIHSFRNQKQATFKETTKKQKKIGGKKNVNQKVIGNAQQQQKMNTNFNIADLEYQSEFLDQPLSMTDSHQRFRSEKQMSPYQAQQQMRMVPMESPAPPAPFAQPMPPMAEQVGNYRVNEEQLVNIKVNHPKVKQDVRQIADLPSNIMEEPKRQKVTKPAPVQPAPKQSLKKKINEIKIEDGFAPEPAEASGPQQTTFVRKKFAEFVDIDNKHKISQCDEELFGDRSPAGFEKVRLVSKLQHTVIWLFKQTYMGEENEMETKHVLIQQIPRVLPSFQEKMKNLQILENKLYQKLLQVQGMLNLVFEVDEILDDKANPDVWVIYQTEEELEKYWSLNQLLFDIKFDPSHVTKIYELQHSIFFQMLSKDDGKYQLAKLITYMCSLLKGVADIGAIYGNLRTENVLIKLGKDNDIESVKFINFHTLKEIETADHIAIPDQIDHLPPDMTQYMLEMKRFSKQSNCTQMKRSGNDANVKFLQSAASADIFGLGVILLQIATGCPSQLELPVKLKCTSIENVQFLTAPHFGHLIKAQVNDQYVQQTIKLQNKMLTNLNFFMRSFKSKDYYNLLSEKYFLVILKRMISPHNYSRPNVSEVLNCKFITNQMNRGKAIFKPSKNENTKRVNKFIKNM